MEEPLYYLRPDVGAEPLIDRWYAWAYLIPPVTSALYARHIQTKILESYIANPALHEQASQKPDLRGGPFVQAQRDISAEISAYKDETAKKNQALTALADAVKEADELLEDIEDGEPLAPLYEELPAPLQGRVELQHDRANAPSMRPIEPLFYNDPTVYDVSRQEVRLFHVSDQDRPSAHSSPRVAGTEGLFINRPFADGCYDVIFSARRTPQPLRVLSNALGLDDPESLLPYLTTDAPNVPERYEGDEPRWRFFGHACVLVETKDVTILSDPLIGYGYRAGLDGFTIEDLPGRIHYVVITHNHRDHVVFELLLQLRNRIDCIVVGRNNGSILDPSLARILRQIGFENVIELDEYGEIPVPGGKIIGLPFLGEHGDLGIQSKLIYRVHLNGKSTLLVADAGAIMPQIYGEALRRYGPLDMLFLGMESEGAPLSWEYGPLLVRPLERSLDKQRRLNGAGSKAGLVIAQALETKKFLLYAMGMEPWLNFILTTNYEDEDAPQLVEARGMIARAAELGITGQMARGKVEGSL